MSLLGKKQHPKRLTCADVVDAYGATLERINWADSPVVSEEELPFPKPLIKEALVTLAVTGQKPVPVSTYKAGFIELATFQQEVPSNQIPWSKISPPTDRAGMVEFVGKYGTSLKDQSSIIDFIQGESQKLAREWDARIALAQEVKDA